MSISNDDICCSRKKQEEDVKGISLFDVGDPHIHIGVAQTDLYPRAFNPTLKLHESVCFNS